MKFLNINDAFNFSAEDIVKEFNNYMRNEEFYGADLEHYYGNIKSNDFYMIYSIHWGDWKHDHNWFRFLVYSFFRHYNVEIYSITIEEDGSDTYSAEYKISISI